MQYRSGSYMTCKELRMQIYHAVDYLKRKGQIDQIHLAMEVLFRAYRARLPLFPDNRYLDISDSKDLTVRYFTEVNKLRSVEIPISSLYGNTWLFANDRTDGRPLPERLARILMYILAGKKLLEIDVAKFGNKYLTSDGNHRIYMAYVMGMETIPGIVSCEIIPRENK